MTIITESGPPKSGKTARLITQANLAHNSGKEVVFFNYEMTPEALRVRGLHNDIPIKNASEEAVEVTEKS